MEIRQATPSDHKNMLALFVKTVRLVNAKDYSPRQIDKWASTANDLSVLEKLSKDHEFYVCEDENEDELMGFCSINSKGFIHSFFVSSDFQRKGVGTTMISFIIKYGLLHKIGELEAEVSVTAKPFFEKFRFIVETPQIISIGEVPFRNFRMKYALERS